MTARERALLLTIVRDAHEIERAQRREALRRRCEDRVRRAQERELARLRTVRGAL